MFMSELEQLDNFREVRRMAPRHQDLAFRRAMRELFDDDDRGGQAVETIDQTRIGLRPPKPDMKRKVVHYVSSGPRTSKSGR